MFIQYRLLQNIWLPPSLGAATIPNIYLHRKTLLNALVRVWVQCATHKAGNHRSLKYYNLINLYFYNIGHNNFHGCSLSAKLLPMTQHNYFLPFSAYFWPCKLSLINKQCSSQYFFMHPKMWECLLHRLNCNGKNCR